MTNYNPTKGKTSGEAETVSGGGIPRSATKWGHLAERSTAHSDASDNPEACVAFSKHVVVIDQRRFNNDCRYDFDLTRETGCRGVFDHDREEYVRVEDPVVAEDIPANVRDVLEEHLDELGGETVASRLFGGER